MNITYNYISLIILVFTINIFSHKIKCDSSLDEFIDIKKIPLNDNYFVVLNTGLYIYNFNTLICSLILKFNSYVYKEVNNKIVTKELDYKNKLYILCLVNDYLFIFNAHSNKTLSYKLNIEDIPNINYYYDLLPYKIINNTISFIIPFNKEENNLIFYYFNFELNNNSISPNPNKILFDNLEILNKTISCQISPQSSFIKCFYYKYINLEYYFLMTKFIIQENMYNIFLNGDFTLEKYNYDIIQIKTIISSNDNIFIALIDNNELFYYILKNSSSQIDKINCMDDRLNNKGYGINYKLFYFKETEKFMFISRVNLVTTILNIYNYSLEICGQTIFSEDQINEYSIIYNNDYKVVNYTNFFNYMTCQDINIAEICLWHKNEISCYEKCTYNYFYDEDKNYFCTESEECPENYDNIIEDEKKCVSNCNEEKDENGVYRYEYKKKCLLKCPDLTLEDNINYICIPICDLNSPFIEISSQECVKECHINDIIKETCILKFEDNAKYYDIMLNNIEKDFTSDKYNTKNIEKNSNEIIKYGLMTVTLTSTEIQNKDKDKNETIIYFGKCEAILRNKYNISNSTILYIKKIDVIQPRMKIPKIEYDIYSKLNNTNLIKLNLSYCGNITIDLYIPAQLTESIDKLNSSSDYYNDICYADTSENNIDIILKDRQKEFIEKKNALSRKLYIF